MLKRKSSPQTPNGGSENCSWEENLSLLEVAGSSPAGATTYSGLAQQVEQTAVNRLVAGSNPAAGANTGALSSVG